MKDRGSSAEIGAIFFGGRIETLDLVRKELAADALLHGLQVRNRSITRILPGFLLCSIAALAAVFWSAIRYGTSAKAPESDELWLAAHAEWSNRTRHLLGLVPAGDRPLPLILLGRPKSSIRKVRQLLQRHLPAARFVLVRPISLSAAVAALPAMIAALRHALREISRCGTMPPPARAVAILYRLCLGEVHRNWWRRSGARPAMVIYAHTGNADTSALELEQQAAGARTVHLFHGISTGHAFTGLSDIAIPRCRHDCEWHGAMGGYGKLVTFAAPKPEPAQPTTDWALLTNYAHPTAFANEATAVELEIRAIRVVSSAAERCGPASSRALYRPHPSFALLSEAARQDVAAAADAAGLQPWPAGRPLDSLSQFDVLVTTPSTILLDGLCGGAVPILVDLAGMETASVYGVYPFRAGSEDGLVEMVRKVRENREAAFERAWQAVGPAVFPSLEQIRQLPDG